MGKHRSISNNKFAGGLLLGAVASGSLAVAALGGAGTASAGCVSISGQSLSSGGGGLCFTTSDLGNIAVANGANAGAEAFGGPGNIAVAAGTTTLPQNSARRAGGGNFALAQGNPGSNNGSQGTFPIDPTFGDFNVSPTTTSQPRP